MLDDVLIIGLRTYAIVGFCWLLTRAIRSALGGTNDPALRRSQFAVTSMWFSLSYTSTYATLYWIGVPITDLIGGIAVGSLSIAIINAAAVSLSLWAYRPWQDGEYDES